LRYVLERIADHPINRARPGNLWAGILHVGGCLESSRNR
jgi:hypothetical protein